MRRREPSEAEIRLYESHLKALDDAEQEAFFRAVQRISAKPDLPPPGRHVRDPRRPRRDVDLTYRLRAELQGTSPPVRRVLETSSHLTLDAVHDVLQAAFGFTDRHLHMFAVGPSMHDPASSLYLCPWDSAEGELEGVDERDVRLDELLVDPGEQLLYEYDYGDSWQFTITLDGVTERRPDAPKARLVDGEHAGPPENCGGVARFEQLVAAGVDPAFDQRRCTRAVDAVADRLAQPVVTEFDW
jgi:hypothetical protein